MKKLFLLILVLLKCQDVLSQDINSEIISTEASIIVPMGKLANKFEYAHSYGFWFKLGEDNGFVASAGFTAILLKNARAIEYEFKDSVYNIRSNKYGFDVGIRATKIIPLFDNNHYLELDATLGLHYLDYDFPSEKEDEKKENDEPLFKNTTLIVAPEIKYIYKNVGLKLQYRFTPYNMIEGIESKFGSHSIAFGIVYKQ